MADFDLDRMTVPEAFGRAKSNGKSHDKKEDASNRSKEREREKSDEEKSEKQGDQEKEDKEGKDEKQDKKEEPKKPPLYKRPVLMISLAAVLVAGVIVGVVWWLYARQFESTDDAFIDGHVVQISPNVAATVLAVHIDDNSRVKKGDLLVELDPKDYRVVVDQTKASLASAEDQMQQAKAELAVAQANDENASRDYERFASLSDRARSQQQLDNAAAAKKTADAQVLSAQAKITGAQAGIEHAQADLQQANINLNYCNIYAPQDGMITHKSVEPGDYVEKAQPLFSIVPTNVWVTANFKETQLDLMRPGQPVTIHVDAYSDKDFHGKVDSIQNGTGEKFTLLPPENATGNYVKVVQRVPVKIVFDPGETEDAQHLLGLGMSVVPKVKVR